MIMISLQWSFRQYRRSKVRNGLRISRDSSACMLHVLRIKRRSIPFHLIATFHMCQKLFPLLNRTQERVYAEFNMAASLTPYTVHTLNSRTSRPVVSQCLVVQTPMGNLSKNMLSTSMPHVACKSKLRSFVRSSVHPCPGNWVAIERLVVHYTRSDHPFGAGIKCRHCICTSNLGEQFQSHDHMLNNRKHVTCLTIGNMSHVQQ